MAGSLADDTEDKPLDPAVERVRRKLLRFVAINLGLLFTAVIVVVAAVVYKSTTLEEPATPAAGDIRVPSGEVLSAEIAIPAGARIVSQSLSGSRIALDIERADGQRVLVVYDMAERRIIAELAVKPQ